MAALNEKSMKVSADKTSPAVGHTNPECPHWPDNVRDADDGDSRRGIRQCNWCKAHEE